MLRRVFLASAAGALGAARLTRGEMPDVEAFGHLRGRVVFDGEPPKPVVFFAKGGLVGPLIDESLLVHAENRGLANVAICLNLKRGEKMPPIHPDYGMHVATPDGPRTKIFSVTGARFEPHLLLLRTDERLVIRNADVDACVPKIDAAANDSIALALPGGAEKSAELKRNERLPIMASCATHPWMSARIVVKDHPYMAATDADGRFEIRNVPAGEREFQFWHEKCGYLSDVKRGDVLERWRRGCATVDIAADKTLDLGDILISPDRF